MIELCCERFFGVELSGLANEDLGEIGVDLPGTYLIGMKTWSEIIEENLARLQFIKDALEHRVDDGQALAYLQERHKELLEGVVVEDDDDEGSEEDVA